MLFSKTIHFHYLLKKKYFIDEYHQDDYKSFSELQHLAIILLELAKVDFVISDVAVECKAEKQDAGL